MMNHERIISRLDRTIILVGMMATGKTRLGRMLARTLKLEFIDTDQKIAADVGLSIAEIFEKYGEMEFRDRESEVIRRLLGTDRSVRVIATGGGAPMREENAGLIFGQTLSIWTRAEIPVILKRAGKTGRRPLLMKGNPEKTLRDMAALRYPVYQRADLTIDTDHGLPRNILQNILTGIEDILTA
ncbi:MAG TPA: shikimate kinase [Micavibrio sp.]